MKIRGANRMETRMWRGFLAPAPQAYPLYLSLWLKGKYYRYLPSLTVPLYVSCVYCGYAPLLDAGGGHA